MLEMNARDAGLVAWKEIRQLVGRENEIEAGNDEEQDADEHENDFHGIILVGADRLELEADSGHFVNATHGKSLHASEENSMTDVVNNKAQHRYELTVDGHLAATYYKVADGVITFIHTEVPPELGGKGVGSRLVKGALDQVRADGLKVIAECPFVKAYIDKHGEYADLLKH